MANVEIAPRPMGRTPSLNVRLGCEPAHSWTTKITKSLYRNTGRIVPKLYTYRIHTNLRLISLNDGYFK